MRPEDSEKGGSTDPKRGGGNKPSTLETTPDSLCCMWRAGPLSSDSATGFPGLLAGPTVEILNFWKQNLSHSSPMGINRYCCINRLLIVSKSVLKQVLTEQAADPTKQKQMSVGF